MVKLFKHKQFKACPKCGAPVDYNNRLSSYLKSHNVVGRQCQQCNHTWLEVTAEGSAPVGNLQTLDEYNETI